MAAVQAHRIDAVATVVQLPERDAFLAFTSIYLPTPLVIMTRDDAPPIRSLQKLSGLDIAGNDAVLLVYQEYRFRDLRVAVHEEGQ